MSEMENHPLIKLNNVSKTYGEGPATIHALRGVSLEIYQGEVIAIMGPSGSGKTTLLNIFGAMDIPSEGSVLVDGWYLENVSERKLAKFRKNVVGFIFQDFYLIPNLNVLDNVLVPLIPYGIKKRNIEEASYLLKLVGLEERADAKVQNLSGGQRQRVVIARALVNEAAILLADEPTGNLDSKMGREIIDVLLKLPEKGTTVIIVTHDPRVGEMVEYHPRGRKIIMEDGNVVDSVYYASKPDHSAIQKLEPSIAEPNTLSQQDLDPLPLSIDEPVSEIEHYILSEVEALIEAGKKQINKQFLYQAYLKASNQDEDNISFSGFSNVLQTLANKNENFKTTPKMIKLIY